MCSDFIPPKLFDETDQGIFVTASISEVEKETRGPPAPNEQPGSSHPNLDNPTSRPQDQSVTFFGDENSQETPAHLLSTEGDLRESDENSFESAEEEMDALSLQRDALDLARSINGMYRILDLISEQGSSGLVDKIIISQNSLKTFINHICPGAYTSMTKVNFKALDNFIIKPVGLYGSKEEIVRFLLQLGVIDEIVASQLLVNVDTHAPTKPTLRSGLYILKGLVQASDTNHIFLVYWPEETTWDDTAGPSVVRNRVTFMRYLTKMCDQAVALISSEHSIRKNLCT